jgi:(5-formylfuran-3-yl)methyl phosphate synthase
VQVLISPIDLEEARAVCDGGADIVDIKNVDEGSLGASFPWVIRGVVKALEGRDVTFSATLGDLTFKPGTASLAALGAAVAGARYVKAGLHGMSTYEEGKAMMDAVVRTCREYDPAITVVAAGYADYRRFGGIDTGTLVRIAKDSGSDLVMVDTAIKDGSTLFDVLSLSEIEDFVGAAHRRGLLVALAGSVKQHHLRQIHGMGTDVVGVRGAVCPAGNRGTRINASLVRDFVAFTRNLAAEN